MSNLVCTLDVQFRQPAWVVCSSETDSRSTRARNTVGCCQSRLRSNPSENRVSPLVAPATHLNKTDWTRETSGTMMRCLHSNLDRQPKPVDLTGQSGESCLYPEWFYERDFFRPASIECFAS